MIASRYGSQLPKTWAHAVAQECRHGLRQGGVIGEEDGRRRPEHGCPPPPRTTAARRHQPARAKRVAAETITQALASGCPLPTAGEAEAKKPASPTTMAAIPSNSCQPMVR